MKGIHLCRVFRTLILCGCIQNTWIDNRRHKASHGFLNFTKKYCLDWALAITLGIWKLVMLIQLSLSFDQGSSSGLWNSCGLEWIYLYELSLGMFPWAWNSVNTSMSLNQPKGSILKSRTYTFKEKKSGRDKLLTVHWQNLHHIECIQYVHLKG